MNATCKAIKKIGGKSKDVPSGPPMPPIEFNLPPRFKKSVAEELVKTPSPRLINTHLGHEFFDNNESLKKTNTKFIVLMRNIKDTLVSYYYFYRNTGFLGFYKGSFEEFMDIFKAKDLVYGDYFDWVLGWNQHRNNPNYFFFKYEDMKANPKAEIKRVAEVLGVTLTDEQVDEVSKEIEISKHRENLNEEFEKWGPPRFLMWLAKHGIGPLAGFNGPPKVEDICRKGVVGDWKNHFTPELREYVDNLHKEMMKDPRAKGLQFVDSI